MQNYDKKCVICGIDVDGQPFHELSFGSSISSSWKKDCATSLCQILFQFDENVCLPYFQNGDYCSQCLQVVRDVDFNWKQLITCKRQIKKSSRRICELMKTNLNCIADILPGEPDSTQSVSGVNQRYRKEVVHRIQLVVSDGSTYCEKGNCISETDGFQENFVNIPIKEENFDWETRFEESSALNEFHNYNANEYVNSGSVPELHQSRELEETIETNVTYEDMGIIFRSTKASNEQILSLCFAKIESELQTELSENQKKSLRGVIGGIKIRFSQRFKQRKASWERFKKIEQNWLNTKIKVKVDNDSIQVPPNIKQEPRMVKSSKSQKFRNIAHFTASGDEDSPGRYESQLSDYDSDGEPPSQNHSEDPLCNTNEHTLPERVADENINSSEPKIQVAQERCPTQRKLPKRHHAAAVRTKNKISSGDEDSADNYESGLPDHTEWQPPPPKENLNRFVRVRRSKIKTNCENEEAHGSKSTNEKSKSRVHKNITVTPIHTPLILKDSERATLEHICTIKAIKLKRLNETEMALTAKIARYTRWAIFKSKLSKKQKEVACQLQRKFRKNISSQRAKPPRNDFFHRCKEENCGAKYMVEEKLEAHIRGVHLGESLPYYCTSCPSKFAQYICMRSHRRKVHQGVKFNNHFFCDICHKGYKTQDELKSHSENAHRGPNPFTCAFCETEFSTSIFLIRHTNESHSEVSPQQLESIRKLTCEKCGRLCASGPALRNHYLRKHKKEVEQSVNKDRSFNCKQCDKTFPSKGRLEYHISSVHEAVICEECGKSCPKSSLSAHQRRHRRILKHKCKICGKQYLTADHLRNHERVHSGVRAFVCPVCGKGFLTQSVLHGHEKTHEPGYIPRKPIRRNRQNRKKKQEDSEQLSQSAVAASQLTSGRNNEHPSTATQSAIVNNYQGSQWMPFFIPQSNAFVNKM